MALVRDLIFVNSLTNGCHVSPHRIHNRYIAMYVISYVGEKLQNKDRIQFFCDVPVLVINVLNNKNPAQSCSISSGDIPRDFAG